MPTSDIFVVIPSYRDPQIVDSVNRLRENATSASLRFGIVLHDDDESVVSALASMPDVDLFHQPASAARGVAFARVTGWSMWEGEPWGLSVDAHSGAARGWDEACLSQQRIGTKLSGKPAILSASSAAEDWLEPDRPRPGGFVFDSGGTWGKGLVGEGYDTTWLPFPEKDRPLPARMLSMAFSFFPGKVFELLWPPWITYWTEEPWFTLSTFNAGYSLWHPEGLIITTSCWYQQEDTGSYKYRADRPVGILSENRSGEWSRSAALSFFAENRHNTYHQYSGADNDYPRNTEWWSGMTTAPSVHEPRARVFVAIPSYRDTAVVETINRLRDEADHDLRFGVCLQDDDEQIAEALRAMPDVDLIHLPPEAARGAAFARRICWSQYGGEDWALSVDAHVPWIIPHWDSKLIVQATNTGHPKPVLSCWPAYQPEEGHWLVQVTDLIRYSDPDSPFSWLEARHLWRDSPPDIPLPCRNLCAAMLFGPGSIMEDIRWPWWLDSGDGAEEPCLTIQAWEAGYSLWHPEGSTIGTLPGTPHPEHGRQRRWADGNPPGWHEPSGPKGQHCRDWFESPDRQPFRDYAGIQTDGTALPHDEWIKTL